MKSLILAAATLLAAASAQAQSFEKNPIQGQSSAIREQRTVVVRTEQEWKSLWVQHSGTEQAPAVDFSREMVVGVFLGERRTAGYKVAVVIQPDPMDSNKIVVFYREIVPAKSGFAAEVVSRPYVLVKVKIRKTVSFEVDQRCSVPEGEGRKTAPKAITPDGKVRMDKVVEGLGAFGDAPSFDR